MRPEAGPSDRRSFGSNHNSSGRFPKVSIGIAVDKRQKLQCVETNENGIATLAWERRPSSPENIVKQNKEYGVLDASKTDGHLIFTNKNASESLSGRCMPQETPAIQTDHALAEHTAALDTEDLTFRKFVASKVDQTGEAENFPAYFLTKSVVHEMPTGQKIQLFGNQTTLVESQDEVHRRTANIAIAKIKEVAAAAITSDEEKHMLYDGVHCEQPKEVAIYNSEALRMKLREILDNTSREEQNMDSPKPENGRKPSKDQFVGPSMTNQIMNTLHPEEKEERDKKQKRALLEGKSTKAKHNSDTIETDSESPNEIIKRPATGSLTRKKAPPSIVKSYQGTRCCKLPLSSSSESKLKLGENMFAFDKGDAKAPNSGGHVNIQSIRSNGKMNEQKILKKIQIPRKLVLNKNIESNKRGEIVPCPDKVTPRNKKTSSVPCPSSKDNKDKWQTSSKAQHVNHHLDPEAKKKPTNIPLAGSAKTQQHCDSHKRKRYSGGHANNQVPVYLPKGNNNPSAGKTSIQNSDKVPSMNHPSDPKAIKNFTDPPEAGCAETQEYSDIHKRKRYSGEHRNIKVPFYMPKGNGAPSVGKTSIPFVDLQSPTFVMDASPPQRRKPRSENLDLCTPVASQGRISSKTPSRSNSDNLKSGPGSSDETREMTESEKFPHEVKGKETQCQPFLSPSNNLENKSFEASDSSYKGCRSSEEWFFNDRSPPKSHVGFHQRKRIHSPKDKITSKRPLSSPTAICTTRTEEPIGAYELMERYPENSLARAVCQLTLALESFRTKMKSQACKKTSEILSAAAEEIHLQLRHAESQIETNIGKFLTISKSKSKCLESRFQEQQERLKLIHDKYKEEVDQHLLGCKNTLEKIEACNKELKVGLDRQKSSNRKILQQVEEAMDSRLRDAETRVAAIHQEANKQMNGLRKIVRELMSEDSLG